MGIPLRGPSQQCGDLACAPADCVSVGIDVAEACGQNQKVVTCVTLHVCVCV